MGRSTMSSSTLIAVICLLCVAIRPAVAACSTSLQFNNSLHTFSTCLDLNVQGATLAWTLIPANNTIRIGFSGSAPSSSGWVGWGLNPTSAAMAGTSAFIAFSAANGSNVLTYKLTTATYSLASVPTSPIDYVVDGTAVEISGENMSMLVIVRLPANQTTLNHVWNRGSSVNNFQPTPHSLSANDLLGARQIDMSSGVSTTVAPPNQILKNRHAVINTVGWGILLPLGVMSARYLRPFSDPLWFYLHIAFQCTGYALGVAGWATGLKLGNASKGVVHHKHRNVGIVLFALSTLQVMALLLRPKKDNKIRKYWNVYHHGIGFSVIILGVMNIFFGFDILIPQEKWRHAYDGVLAALGGIALLLEIVTWIIFFRRKKTGRSQSMHGAIVNGGKSSNGIDGFGPTEYNLNVV